MISEHRLFLHRRERNRIINKCAFNLKSTIYTQGSSVTLESHISVSFKNFESAIDNKCGKFKKLAKTGTRGSGSGAVMFFFNYYRIGIFL